jgi:hypothetical protein
MKTKDGKKRLFEVMQRVAPNFSQNNYRKILNDFPGHAKNSNPIDSPQYKWYQEVLQFMQGNNNVNEKSELVKFFQNNFLGMDYDILQTPAETVSWWLAPEQQEFIKGELNATPEKALNETGEWSDDDEGIAWKESLRNELDEISVETHGKLKIIDIKGFDKYQGPYAIVNIQGKNYKVWTMEEQGQLWIENYPVDNTSGEGKNAGFQGDATDIIQMLDGNKVSTKDFSYNFNESETGNQKYMDDTIVEKVISTLINAKNNIQDIFEKLPIADEIPQNEAKILMDAMTVLHELEVRYGNENHGIGAINGKFNKVPPKI